LHGRFLEKSEALLLKYQNSQEIETKAKAIAKSKEVEGKIPAQPGGQGTTGIFTSEKE